jgi:tetratricopeptide (TPR) repeat protein
MNSLPKRTRNHVLETISENYLRNQIPAEWILNRQEIDYGIDFNCEFVTNNEVLGTNFSIQLKSKENADNKDFVVVKDLKRTTINRWLKRLEPTAIVVYVENLKEAFWTWVESDTFDLTKPNKTFQIKIPKSNVLSTTNWDNVYSEVENIFRRRHRLYELPKNISKLEEKDTWRYYFENEWRLALMGFYELIKEDNKNPLFWNSIAFCEYQLYNYKKALVAVNNALELKDDKLIRMNKASILTEYGIEQKNNKFLELAMEEYEKLLKGTSDETIFYNYANCQKSLGLFDQAKEYYEKSLRLNPNNARAWKNLGSVYFELRNHQLELKCYDNALGIEPNLFEAMFSKGVTLFKVFGKIEQGLDFMIKAEQLDEDNNYEFSFPYVTFWIAEAYLELGKIEKALEWNNNGLKIIPADDYLIHQKNRIKTA